MPKNDNKPHHKSEGVKLVGSPAALINLLIRDKDLNEWTTEHIVNEGPKHKQVLTALLLNRLYALVQSIESSTDTVFTLQEGYELTKEKGAKGDVLPVSLPIHLGLGMNADIVAEAVSKAPEHEVLAYAMGLQVIEWAIKATSKKVALAQAMLIGDGS
jgi:hypothetical protein